MKKKAFGLSRRGPDYVAEELVTVLAANEWFEFKPLFLLVLANLRARNAAGGGEEMLRLRVYEKLQNLVAEGIVEKSLKRYRGVPASLFLFKDHLAAQHCRTLLNVVSSAPVADPATAL